MQISNCGNVIIHKATVPSPDPTDTTFAYTTTGGLDPATFGLKNGGTQDYGSEVPVGSGTVTETNPAPNFALTGLELLGVGDRRRHDGQPKPGDEDGVL